MRRSLPRLLLLRAEEEIEQAFGRDRAGRASQPTVVATSNHHWLKLATKPTLELDHSLAQKRNVLLRDAIAIVIFCAQ